MAILFFFSSRFPIFFVANAQCTEKTLCGGGVPHAVTATWRKISRFFHLQQIQSLKFFFLLFLFVCVCVCVCIFSSHLLHPYHCMSLHLIEEREHNHTPIASFSYVLPLDTHSERASERAKEGTQYFIQQNFHSRHTCNICYKSFHLFIF